LYSASSSSIAGTPAMLCPVPGGKMNDYYINTPLLLIYK
jgi:hypothetical protein